MATTPITTIQIVHESDAENAASLDNELVGQGSVDNDHARGILNRIIGFFASMLAGWKNAKMILAIENATAGIFAFGTATITHANLTNGDTLVIAGVTLTKAAAPANENEFASGADATADAVSVKNCINAHSVLSKFFVATSAAGVVTVTARHPGLLGTLFTWSTNDATAFALAPATKLGNVTSTFTRSVTTLNRGVA